MVLVTAVYLIIRRHRRGLVRREATRGHVNSQSEHENASHSGRTEWHVATPRAIPSEEVLVREPPPAYIPGEVASWQDDVEGFRVRTAGSSKCPALKRFSN